MQLLRTFVQSRLPRLLIIRISKLVDRAVERVVAHIPQLECDSVPYNISTYRDVINSGS